MFDWFIIAKKVQFDWHQPSIQPCQWGGRGTTSWLSYHLQKLKLGVCMGRQVMEWLWLSICPQAPLDTHWVCSAKFQSVDKCDSFKFYSLQSFFLWKCVYPTWWMTSFLGLAHGGHKRASLMHPFSAWIGSVLFQMFGLSSGQRLTVVSHLKHSAPPTSPDLPPRVLLLK